MENKTFSEVNAFEGLSKDSLFMSMLNGTSVGTEDAANRLKVYSDVMSNYKNLKDTYESIKNFSGYAEIPLASNQYFNASMASYVRSYAGFLTVERSMDQPTSLCWYNDVLGVVDNRVVLPNIGKEDLKGINARFETTGQCDAENSISTNKKLIPGSVKIYLISAADAMKTIEISDNRKGELLAPAGVLTLGTVNYLTGMISFNVTDPSLYSKFKISGFEDVAGDPAFGQLTGPGNNRFKVDLKQITLTAEPDMLIGENNLMSIAAAKKAVGFDLQNVMGQKLTELYTKLVNEKLVEGIMDGDESVAYEIPMDKYSSHFVDYNSRLEAFQADLVEIDAKLAQRTVKATQATAYVVGINVGNWFQKLKATGNWTSNKESTYVNDLLGYYNGIPVLRHLNIPANSGYAIHKTPGGECAPLMRGIYLPLTNTPIVGNYNNPTQYANGVYYQEVNDILYPELIQRFEVKDPANGPFNVSIQ
jgi:hypothetical protein